MRLKGLLVLFLLAFAPVLSAAEAETFTEGTHYTRIDPPVPTDAPGKVQVVELFWYGCPHCYQFEPVLSAWLKQKPEFVQFVRIPAVFRPGRWQLHARAFYAAEELGVLDKVHKDLFDALHVQNNPLATEDELAQFFADRGVPKQQFLDALNSFTTQTKVGRATELSRRYGITGVPAVVVAGKYRVNGSSYSEVLRITDFLIRKERTGR